MLYTFPSRFLDQDDDDENEEPLEQIVYTSSAYTRELPEEEIDQILATSRKNNKRDKVTGLLVSSSRARFSLQEEKMHRGGKARSRESNLLTSYALFSRSSIETAPLSSSSRAHALACKSAIAGSATILGIAASSRSTAAARTKASSNRK